MVQKLVFGILFAVLVSLTLASAQCTDTDSGENYPVKGSITGIDIEKNAVATYEDKCDNPTWITEYYCYTSDAHPDGYIVSGHRSCLKCEEGACPDTCTDSDGGKDYYTAGVVTIEAKDKSKKETYEDECKEYSCAGPMYSMFCKTRESSEKIYMLTELYCNKEGYQAAEQVKCDDGCGAGACFSMSGTSASIAGLQKEITTLKADIALLKEKISALEQKCAAPSQPSTAATPVTIGSCTDSDGGITTAVKGTAKGLVLSAGKTMSFSDECINKNKVKEYFCASGKKYTGYLNYKIEPCPNGCQNGICSTQPITG